MSGVSKYAPEGYHFCQNGGDCDNRGKSIRASKMIKIGKYFVCGEKCEKQFRDKYVLYGSDIDNQGKTTQSQ